MNEEQILLIDDQPSAAKASLLALSHFVPEKQITYVSTVAKAMTVLAEQTFSLVFLDIDMPDTNGFSMAGYLEDHYPGLPYVFLTGYANFAARSYDYEPLDFLTKPIDILRLQKTFDRFRRQQPAPPPVEKIALHTKQDYIFLNPQDILYIFREKRKNLIRCLDGSIHPVTSSLDELEVIFGDYGFFRCHQSYLIPLSAITSLRPSPFGQTYDAALGEHAVIPVSRNRFAALREALARRGIRFL